MFDEISDIALQFRALVTHSSWRVRFAAGPDRILTCAVEANCLSGGG